MTPIKSVHDTLRLRALRAAIASYKAAKQLMDAFEDVPHSESTDNTSQLVAQASSDAETHLLTMILSFDPLLTCWEYDVAPRMNLPGRAIVLDGSLYLAVPDPDSRDAISPRALNPDGTHLMRLAIVEAANVANLDRSEGGGR